MKGRSDYSTQRANRLKNWTRPCMQRKMLLANQWKASECSSTHSRPMYGSWATECGLVPLSFVHMCRLCSSIVCGFTRPQNQYDVISLPLKNGYFIGSLCWLSKWRNTYIIIYALWFWLIWMGLSSFSCVFKWAFGQFFQCIGFSSLLLLLSLFCND